MEKFYIVFVLIMSGLAVAEATCYTPAQVTQPIREPVATIK